MSSEHVLGHCDGHEQFCAGRDSDDLFDEGCCDHIQQISHSAPATKAYKIYDCFLFLLAATLASLLARSQIRKFQDAARLDQCNGCSESHEILYATCFFFDEDARRIIAKAG